MGMLYLLYILMVIVCRFFAGYDSRYQTGKFIVIRSPKVRALLVDSVSFYDRSKRLKKDVHKMSVIGVVLYAVAAVSLVGSVVAQLAIPPISVDPLVIETDQFIMRADTLNTLISAAFIWAYLLCVMLCCAVCIVRSVKKEKRWVRIVVYAVAVIMVAVVGFVAWQIAVHIIGCTNLSLANLKMP